MKKIKILYDKRDFINILSTMNIFKLEELDITIQLFEHLIETRYFEFLHNLNWIELLNLKAQLKKEIELGRAKMKESNDRIEAFKEKKYKEYKNDKKTK